MRHAPASASFSVHLSPDEGGGGREGPVADATQRQRLRCGRVYAGGLLAATGAPARQMNRGRLARAVVGIPQTAICCSPPGGRGPQTHLLHWHAAVEQGEPTGKRRDTRVKARGRAPMGGSRCQYDDPFVGCAALVIPRAAESPARRGWRTQCTVRPARRKLCKSPLSRLSSAHGRQEVTSDGGSALGNSGQQEPEGECRIRGSVPRGGPTYHFCFVPAAAVDFTSGCRLDIATVANSQASPTETYGSQDTSSSDRTLSPATNA